MTNSISTEAAARRDAARNSGRFGVQEHTGPELTIDLHSTEMDEDETRTMPLSRADSGWHDDETNELATAVVERQGVHGMVTRVKLPLGASDPAARYDVTLRSTHTGDSGVTFTYETGNQDFERVTPTVAETLADAAFFANQERGAVTEEGGTTQLDRLIRLLGEQDARDLLANAYLRAPAAR